MGTSDEEKEIFRFLLRIFQDIVHKKNIRYFLYAGSLIGYYRNRTILAWDDDVDVSMDYNGYRSFLASLDTLNDIGSFRYRGRNCHVFKIFSKSMSLYSVSQASGNYSKNRLYHDLILE